MAPAANWRETAMLVIDMQKEFVDPRLGSPALLASGAAVLPAVGEAVAVARERGIFVVWVVREHEPSGRDVELFRRHVYTGGKGLAVKGSKGAELAEGLAIEEGDYKLGKTRFSSFFATPLDSVLKASGIKKLVVVDNKHCYISTDMEVTVLKSAKFNCRSVLFVI